MPSHRIIIVNYCFKLLQRTAITIQCEILLKLVKSSHLEIILMIKISKVTTSEKTIIVPTLTSQIPATNSNNNSSDSVINRRISKTSSTSNSRTIGVAAICEVVIEAAETWVEWEAIQITVTWVAPVLNSRIINLTQVTTQER